MLCKNKISVVITTFNGQDYILEQLNSIKNQTVQPDEVIIRDDCSTDKTWEILKNYVKENQLDTWRIVQNKKNEGWKMNFRKAMEMATGDIVFLSDQDDIWMNDKIKKMITVMESNPQIELLVSEYDILVDGEIKTLLHPEKMVSNYPFNRKFFHTRRPGAVFAFRKELLQEVLPFWRYDLPHDAQLWLIAIVRRTLYSYNRPLILYRRHDKTATGRDKIEIKSKLRNVEYECKLIELVQRYNRSKTMLSIKDNIICKKAMNYVKNRRCALENQNVFVWFCSIKFIRFYICKKTYIGDLVAIIKGKFR